MAYKKLKYWFNDELAALLAVKLRQLKPDFNGDRFTQAVTNKVEDLELKDRIECIADELYTALGMHYKNGIHLLLQVLGPENEKETGMFSTYYWIMPIAKYVEKYGLEHLEVSLHAIEEITKRNTGEYTIRPFIENYPQKTLERMKIWAAHPNTHVRRLASEGVRPRLPWAAKLDMFVKDPLPLLPILDILKDDTSKYVQKSVANCINDILKDNFETGKQLIEKWNTADAGKERKWIMKHALRNQLKQENEWALKMISR